MNSKKPDTFRKSFPSSELWFCGDSLPGPEFFEKRPASEDQFGQDGNAENTQQKAIKYRTDSSKPGVVIPCGDGHRAD
jgi:hypothetical protein